MDKKYYVGIDIGSTCAKTVVLDEAGEICRNTVRPTGWSSVDTANEIYEELINAGYIIHNEETGAHEPTTRIIATGYGRVSVPYADKTVTEITCHGKGATRLFDSKDLCIIDIGGQDTKVIRVENGMVAEFFMNDKCSAGTGRFLEVMGNTMGLSPAEVCDLARRGNGVKISSMCTVFAESEIISLIGKGESKENIAFAIVDSIVEKVVSQSGRILKANDKVCLTGGLCQCGFLVETLENKLKQPVATSELGRYAGALGAALSAMK